MFLDQCEDFLPVRLEPTFVIEVVGLGKVDSLMVEVLEDMAMEEGSNVGLVACIYLFNKNLDQSNNTEADLILKQGAMRMRHLLRIQFLDLVLTLRTRTTNFHKIRLVVVF